MALAIDQPQPRSAPQTRQGGRVEPALASLVVAGVLLQAALAGRHIADDASISLHGAVGNAVLIGQFAVMAALARRRAPYAALVSAGLLFGLLVAQIGLGYMGRDTARVVAWHVFNGVALFGLASVQLARYWPGLRR
jgi:hypothetical protein